MAPNRRVKIRKSFGVASKLWPLKVDASRSRMTHFVGNQYPSCGGHAHFLWKQCIQHTFLSFVVHFVKMRFEINGTLPSPFALSCRRKRNHFRALGDDTASWKKHRAGRGTDDMIVQYTYKVVPPKVAKLVNITRWILWFVLWGQ